jgi:UDP-N-acetylglucosamine:LPS N-acetylglucosamine transferase
VPFPDTDLPNAVLTGNPIRPAIVEAVARAERSEARRALVERYDEANDGTSGLSATALDDRVLVAVWAGSLGARRINDAVVELAARWAERDDIILYHVVGNRDWDSHGGPRPDGALPYLRVPYEQHMPDLLVAADLAVCRAGASTVTELAVAGLPSVLVPLPHAPRDHQRANTAEVAEAGGAIVLDDAEVTAGRLADVLEPLVADPGRRREMAVATGSVARPDAAAAVAEVLIDQGALAGRLREIGPVGPAAAPPDDTAARVADPTLERNEPA